MTASAFDRRSAASTAAASNASAITASAPWPSRFFARASLVVIPTTECPALNNSAINGSPIAPLAPATKTRIFRSFLLSGWVHGKFRSVAACQGSRRTFIY